MLRRAAPGRGRSGHQPACARFSRAMPDDATGTASAQTRTPPYTARQPRTANRRAPSQSTAAAPQPNLGPPGTSAAPLGFDAIGYDHPGDALAAGGRGGGITPLVPGSVAVSGIRLPGVGGGELVTVGFEHGRAE